MVFPPVSVYACYFLYITIGYTDSRSGKDMDWGRLKPNHLHNGITYPIIEQWDDCLSLDRYKQLGGQDEAQPSKWLQMIYYFICFPPLFLFRMAQKVPDLTKNSFQYGSLPYQKQILVQAGEVLLNIFYWTLWLNRQCDLQCSIILYIPIQDLTWRFNVFGYYTLTSTISREGE